MKKKGIVVENKEVKVLEPVTGEVKTKNPVLLGLMAMSDVEKNIVREILGMRVRTSGTRVTGKVKRTDKKLEVAVCKQMTILINSLPKDKAVDIAEWAKLAIANGLQTQQPPERIVAYYKRNIIELGLAVAVN